VARCPGLKQNLYWKEITTENKSVYEEARRYLEAVGFSIQAVVIDAKHGTVGRFEIKQEIHYHFRCELCGRVIDVNEPVDRELDKKVANRTGLRISYHQLEFRGLFRDCQQLSTDRKE
jgi:Fe2+ or Zn2+ uptake regulation protein